jgi:two-component system phosphate regulon sensor histidine kinase PhoR
MVLIIAAASYFVFRSVNRELSVARLQSDFVDAVSHEFRTPLTAMCHLTEMLEDGAAPSGRLPHYYRALGKESRRLKAMVESLLDFGRIEAGRRTYEFVDTDAAEFVSEIVHEFRERAPSAAHRLELVESPNAASERLRIRADRSALALALCNLVDNALKYSADPSPVKVSVQSAGPFVGIAVEDEGPGISRDEQHDVFRKFARGSAARTLNVKGTGIGLTMAEQIVKAHGGRLELASEPGRGSRFTTLLPVHPRPA